MSLPFPPPLGGAVDVVVPVYGAAAELALCLASLERHTDFTKHRLVLVIDGPQPPEVESALAGSSGTLLRNPARRGFVGSVNRGMQEGTGGDVVLLNSDTEVTAGWLEKLQDAAYSAPDLATVTPFSNNATLCSLPRPFEVNALPAGYSNDSFAALVERVAQRTYPRLPTGVGVCLYIKRQALAELGLFREDLFGLGYGEESEFCARALKAGWRHALDDATFIYHAGQRSFGASRGPRVRAAHRAMRRLHPEYLPAIADFLRRDPLRPERERVLAGLAPPRRTRPEGPPRVLHLVHGWPPWNPAGTEIYAHGLAVRQAAHREVAVYARIADSGRTLGEATELWDHGARVRLLVNNFTQRNPLSRNALHDRTLGADFARFLDGFRPELVHVHHLSGHAAGLLSRVYRRGLPVLYQLQDWWAPCARANLFTAGRELCPGPAAGRCSRCLPLTGLAPAPLLNRALHLYRRQLLRRLLRRADAVVLGSRAIAETHRALGDLPPELPVHLLPYGIDAPPPLPRRRPVLPLRFGYVGSLLPHKGVHVIAEAFAGISPDRARLTLWGDPAGDPGYAAELLALAGPGAVHLAGRFPEGDKPALFADLDALLVPSLGLESFGIVAREALHYGVPVLASRRGALLDLFPAPGAGGRLVEPGDPLAWRQAVEEIAERPEQLAEWAAARPRVHSLDAHAEEIEEVYRSILGNRSRYGLRGR